MLSDRSWRVYRILLSIALVVMLIPTLVMCVHVRPVGDDIPQPVKVYKTWRETGSITQTAEALFEEIARLYRQRNPLFFTMFVSLLPLSLIETRLIGINAVLMIVLLMAAMLRVGWCVGSLFPGMKRDAIAVGSLLLCLFMLLFMPSYYDAFYWFSGAYNYTLSFGMGVLLFTGVVKYAAARNGAIAPLPSRW